MRIGRRRIAPASMSASRSGIPSFSRAHFAKSMSRMAFFATIPMSRITPINDMMLIVFPVIASASSTPMSERGSDIRIASGSRKLPNCTTRIRYIRPTATNSAVKICPNTSFCACESPPSPKRTPGGSVSFDTRATTSLVTSPVARPELFASTETTRSRSR